MFGEWWELVPLAKNPFNLPKFPTEVWEHILDELDVSYGYGSFLRRLTFSACCSVCRAWVPRSRYHLFKYVTVRSGGQVKEVSKLLYSISALRTRVERLTVIGSKDERKDASWVGLVGFKLGPKLKALEVIRVEDVNLSLMKLEDHQLWGAFNRAWRPGARRKLMFFNCKVTHLNQLIRLAFVTKTEELNVVQLDLNEHGKSAPLAAPLSSGISLPLQLLYLHSLSPNLVFPVPWHTFARQCPSLSAVFIPSWNKNLDLSSPDGQLFLVSILHMFHWMQRRNDTNHVTLRIDPLPMIEMRTRPYDQPANNDDDHPATRPRLHHTLILQPFQCVTEALILLEDAMVLTNNANGRFHRIEILSRLNPNVLQPASIQSIDGILSRLCIATHDVHVVIKGGDQPYKGCALPWAREHFPLLTSVVPNAFCDPEAGQPCDSHPKGANGDAAQAQGTTAVDEGTAGEAMETEPDGVGVGAGLEEQSVDVGVDVGAEEAESVQPKGIQATTTEELEVEGEDPREKTRRTE